MMNWAYAAWTVTAARPKGVTGLDCNHTHARTHYLFQFVVCVCVCGMSEGRDTTQATALSWMNNNEVYSHHTVAHNALIQISDKQHVFSAPHPTTSFLYI